MLRAIGVILTFQLLGEGLVRSAELPVPGPVLGLILLLAACALFPALAASVRSTANGFLSHLALLFVPAGVGVVGHLDRLGSFAVEIALVLLVSTLAAIAVGALVFVAIERATGGEE